MLARSARCFEGLESGFPLRLGHACAAKGIGLEQSAWFWCGIPDSVGLVRRSEFPSNNLTCNHARTRMIVFGQVDSIC